MEGWDGNDKCGRGWGQIQMRMVGIDVSFAVTVGDGDKRLSRASSNSRRS